MKLTASEVQEVSLAASHENIMREVNLTHISELLTDNNFVVDRFVVSCLTIGKR